MFKFIGALAIVSLAANPALAEGDDAIGKSFELSVETGVRYDSNVQPLDDFFAPTVSDLSISSSLGAAAAIHSDLGDFTFDVRLHSEDMLEQDEYSSTGYLGSLEYGRFFGPLYTGAFMRKSESEFDVDVSANVDQFGGFIRVWTREFTLLSVTYTREKSDLQGWFIDVDSEADRVGLLFSHPFETGRLSGGVEAVELSEAFRPDRGFDGYRAFLNYSLPVGDVAGAPATVAFDVQLDNRGYNDIHPTFGAVRDDSRREFGASVHLQFTDRLSARLESSYEDFGSNIPELDDEVFMANLRVVFDLVHD